MKTYKVLSRNVVFAIGKQDYAAKQGDTLELPEDHITTRALVERKRIKECELQASLPSAGGKVPESPAAETPQGGTASVKSAHKNKK